MSELVDKIEEKSKENYSSVEEEEKPKEDDNLAINDKEKKSKKKKVTTKGNSLKELKNKNPRLSCQPILSFLKKHGSNYGIRHIPLRKKTTADYYRNHDDNNVLSTFIQSKINNIDNLKSKEGEKSNNKNLKRNNSLNNNKNIEIDLKNAGYKKLKSKLNLYEREKKYLQRKENYIKKKNDLKLKEINENLKGPSINRNSEIIMENKSEYTPIHKRAVKLHNMHLFECILNENKVKLKKLQEEDKEYEIVKQYKNKKTFNENDWENFIKSQEYWKKEKQYKIKAAELFKENLEQKMNYIPEINKNSKLMIENMKKKETSKNKDKDNIYIKLYNDFDDLQERKIMRICNSMPSFKPLLNKSFKKSKFNVKKKNIKSENKFCQKLDLLIKNKLKKSKSISNIPTKYTSVSFINSTGTKNNQNNFILCNDNLKKNSLKNKKPNRYDNSYFEELILLSKSNSNQIQISKYKINQNINKNMNTKDKKKINNINNPKNVNKFNYEYIINRNNNSFIFSNSHIIKEEQ